MLTSGLDRLPEIAKVIHAGSEFLKQKRFDKVNTGVEPATITLYQSPEAPVSRGKPRDLRPASAEKIAAPLGPPQAWV